MVFNVTHSDRVGHFNRPEFLKLAERIPMVKFYDSLNDSTVLHQKVFIHLQITFLNSFTIRKVERLREREREREREEE